jgi:hypothetical protein
MMVRKTWAPERKMRAAMRHHGGHTATLAYSVTRIASTAPPLRAGGCGLWPADRRPGFSPVRRASPVQSPFAAGRNQLSYRSLRTTMWSRSTAGFWADNRARIAENGSVMSTGA